MTPLDYTGRDYESCRLSDLVLPKERYRDSTAVRRFHKQTDSLNDIG